MERPTTQYIQDAKAKDDRNLADFFRRVRDEDSMRADEAQLLLAERTPTARYTEGIAPDIETSPTLSPRAEEPHNRGKRALGDRSRTKTGD